MMTQTTPALWRQGYTLHRRRSGTDSLGDETAYYDMELPDLTVADGAEEGICFQPRRSWISSGTLDSAGATVAEYGQRSNGVLEGVLYAGVELAPFDRLVIGGELYELRTVQHWPRHRYLLLQRVK